MVTAAHLASVLANCICSSRRTCRPTLHDHQRSRARARMSITAQLPCWVHTAYPRPLRFTPSEWRARPGHSALVTGLMAAMIFSLGKTKSDQTSISSLRAFCQISGSCRRQPLDSLQMLVGIKRIGNNRTSNVVGFRGCLATVSLASE